MCLGRGVATKKLIDLIYKPFFPRLNYFVTVSNLRPMMGLLGIVILIFPEV